MNWMVKRHCGRVSGTWIATCVTSDEDEAMLAYDDAAGHMRQGVVQLIDPRGNVVAVESIPPIPEQVTGSSQPPPPRWWHRIRRALSAEVIT